MPAIETDAAEVMLRWRSAVKRKARRVISVIEQLEYRLNQIAARRFVARQPLPEWQIRQAYHKAWGEYEFLDADWRPIAVGDPWGGPDITAFFRRSLTIPDAWAGQPAILRFYVGGDSLLSLDGQPYHGLDPFRNEVLLPASVRRGRSCRSTSRPTSTGTAAKAITKSFTSPNWPCPTRWCGRHTGI